MTTTETTPADAVRDETTMRFYSRATARWFTARLLHVGDRYGLDRCLTWGEGKTALKITGVEFYDATYAADPRFDLGLGQFVTRYYVDSLLDGSVGGLDMLGYEAAWKLDAGAMDAVRAWLRNVVGAHVA